MGDTLILGPSGIPENLITDYCETWQEAIKKVVSGKAEVIESYEGWEVHSPSTTIRVPAVIRLLEHDPTRKRGRSVCFNRDNVMLRDNYVCQYCGGDFYSHQKLLTYDHVIPRFKGGKTRWDNIVMACVNCNSEKAHYDKMKPRRAPYKPDYYELVNNAMTRPLHIPHPSWNYFMGWPEELVRIHVPKKAA